MAEENPTNSGSSSSHGRTATNPETENPGRCGTQVHPEARAASAPNGMVGAGRWQVVRGGGVQAAGSGCRQVVQVVVQVWQCSGVQAGVVAVVVAVGQCSGGGVWCGTHPAPPRW